MKSAAMRMICRFLMVSMVLLPFQTIHAGMIGTDQVAAAASAQADRASVLNMVNRSDVASQLQTLGVNPNVARDRVAAMTDEEIRALAGKLDLLPAGARGSGWAWAAAVIIVIIIWYNWKR